MICVLLVLVALGAPRSASAAIGTLDGCARDNMRRFPLVNMPMLFSDGRMSFRTRTDARGCFRVWLPEGRRYLSVKTTGMFIGGWILPRGIAVMVIPGSFVRADLLLQWHSELEGFRRSPFDLVQRFGTFDITRIPADVPFVIPGLQTGPPGAQVLR